MAEVESKEMIGLFVSGEQLAEIVDALHYKFEALHNANKLGVSTRDLCLTADDWKAAKEIEAAMEENYKKLSNIKHIVEYVINKL